MLSLNNISGTVVLTAGPRSIHTRLAQAVAVTGRVRDHQPAGVHQRRRPSADRRVPRSGAPVDCSAGGVLTQLTGARHHPYAESSFGPLVIAEELGRLPLGLIQAQISVDPAPRADGSFAFPGGHPARPA